MLQRMKSRETKSLRIQIIFFFTELFCFHSGLEEESKVQIQGTDWLVESEYTNLTVERGDFWQRHKLILYVLFNGPTAN